MSELKRLINHKLINRGFFDKKHPGDLRGISIDNFSVFYNEIVDWENQPKLDAVRKDLYEDLYNRLTKFQEKDKYLVNKFSFRIVNYIDRKYQSKDRDRLYIEILLNTARRTTITTICRFFVNGNNLYVASDSYILGRLSIIKVIFHSISTGMLVLSWSLVFYNLGAFLVLLIFEFLYLYFVWINFIRSLFQGDSFWYALKVNFPSKLSSSSFDFDDSIMFLKSVLPTLIDSAKKAFKKNGFDMKSIEERLDEIGKNIGSQTINVNTGGGNIISSLFGGSNNSIR